MSTRKNRRPALGQYAPTSRVVGYLASQQRLAYNHAINILNREPSIPKRAAKGSTLDLNKRITAWRCTRPTARVRIETNKQANKQDHQI